MSKPKLKDMKNSEVWIDDEGELVIIHWNECHWTMKRRMYESYIKQGYIRLGPL